MSFDPEDFDIPRWMMEHGYNSIPVGKSFFIVPVKDGASGGDFVLLGMITTADNGDEATQVIALDQMTSALIAANLSRRVGPEAMYHAMMQVIEADMMAQIKQSQAKDREVTEGIIADVSGGFPVVPPSSEVIEQMIKDDQNKDKDGY